MVADWIAAGLDPGDEHALHPVARARARRAVSAAVDGRCRSRGSSACRPTRSRSTSCRRRICRRSGFSAIRCCRRPTSSSTTPSSCRSARIRCRTSSWRARSCAASTTSTASVFVEPQPLLTTFPRLPGLDNRKMSKSYGNTIDLSDDAGDGAEEGAADVHGPEARARRHPGHGRRATRCSSTTTPSTRTPPKSTI